MFSGIPRALTACRPNCVSRDSTEWPPPLATSNVAVPVRGNASAPYAVRSATRARARTRSGTRCTLSAGDASSLASTAGGAVTATGMRCVLGRPSALE